MKIKKIKLIEIKPTAPFNFDATFHKPDHFASNDNYWEPGVCWQTWWWKNKCFGLKFQNKGKLDKPKIFVTIYGNSEPSNNFLISLINEIKYRYNLDAELANFYKKFEKDKILKPIIKKWRGMRPGHQNSLYEYLIIGVLLQNCTVRRSIQMMQILFEKYGTALVFDNKKLWCFWKPGSLKNVTENELRILKIGYRAKSIKKIDDCFYQGFINEAELRKKDKSIQKEKLLKFYGVGPATVLYLLFDVFHHWDFFNHISPWEQKIYSKLFFSQSPENPVSIEKLLKYFGRYQPYQHLAIHYIWEDLWWKRKNKTIPWLEKLIRI